MKWGDEDDQIQELITTLVLIVATLNEHRQAIEVALACIEQLDARSQVTISSLQSLSARIEKSEE